MIKQKESKLILKIFSLHQAGKMLGTTRQTLMKYVKQNDIPYIRKFNKKIFFTDEQLKLLCQKMNYPYELLCEGGEQDD